MKSVCVAAKKSRVHLTKIYIIGVMITIVNIKKNVNFNILNLLNLQQRFNYVTKTPSMYGYKIKINV